MKIKALWKEGISQCFIYHIDYIPLGQFTGSLPDSTRSGRL